MFNLKQQTIFFLLCASLFLVLGTFTNCTEKEVPDEIPDTISGNVLIDASKGGGGWWFPQGVDCDPALDHQGKTVADKLTSMGLSVQETCREEIVDITTINDLSLLIVAGAYFQYSADEIDKIKDYVETGGNLLLLLDHSTDNSAIGSAFNLNYQSTSSNEVSVAFLPHEITQNVNSTMTLLGVSGITSSEPNITVLANITSEANTPMLIGAMDYGQGKVVFSGDVNIWQTDLDLIKNVVEWLEL